MVFSSSLFLFAFFPAVLLGYYLIDRRFKNFFLLIVSLFFYAWGEPRFVLIMLGSIFVNHIFALLINRQLNYAEQLSCETKENNSIIGAYRRRAKILLVLMVIFNLLLFFIFKYLNFTIKNLNILLSHTGGALIPQTSIHLPIGISFFTFQAMSYVFDVYYRKGEVQKNPLNTALYVSLFPQLIAGPIVRYQTVADEIRNRKETLADFEQGIRRFIIGLGKKVIISNTLAYVADSAFTACTNQALTTGFSWLGAISYSLQLYFDFSGYSDMAIGLGLMFGFHFLENFDHPYISKTVTEFWRRWHISLGSWFRDYVYIPLGGSRVKTKGRLVINLLVVWALTGIWHGANWTFIVWGLMYFLLLAFEKLSNLSENLQGKALLSFCYRIFTLLCIVCGWVVFRSESLNQALSFLSAMAGFAPNGSWNATAQWMWQQYSIILLLAITCCLDWIIIAHRFRDFVGFLVHSKVIIIVRFFLLFILAFISVCFTVANTYSPFIYFNF